MNNNNTVDYPESKSIIPTYALCLYVMFLPFLTLRYNIVGNFLFVIIWLIVLWYNNLTIQLLEKCNIRFGIIMIWALLTSVLATDKEAARTGNIVLLRCIFIPWLIVTVCDDKKKLWMVFTSFVIGTYILIFFVIIENGWNNILYQVREGTRIGDATTNENTIGVNCVISMTILIYLMLYKKRKILLIPAFPLAFFVIGSNSRTGILMITSCVLITIIFANQNNYLKKIILILLVFLVVFVIGRDIPILSHIYSRMEEGLAVFSNENNADSSAVSRIEMAKYGFQIFLKQPITGYGTSQFTSMYRVTAGGRNLAPHNTYIQILTSYGIVGFALWFGMFFSIMNQMLRKKEDLLFRLIFIILFEWLINCMFGHIFLVKDIYLFLGIGFAANKILDGEKERTSDLHNIYIRD